MPGGRLLSHNQTMQSQGAQHQDLLCAPRLSLSLVSASSHILASFFFSSDQLSPSHSCWQLSSVISYQQTGQTPVLSGLKLKIPGKGWGSPRLGVGCKKAAALIGMSGLEWGGVCPSRRRCCPVRRLSRQIKVIAAFLDDLQEALGSIEEERPMQRMMGLKFRHDPGQTQSVFTEHLLWAFEIRMSLGVHLMDHLFHNHLAVSRGEEWHVCSRELRDETMQRLAQGVKWGAVHWEENLRPWRPRKRTSAFLQQVSTDRLVVLSEEMELQPWSLLWLVGYWFQVDSLTSASSCWPPPAYSVEWVLNKNAKFQHSNLCENVLFLPLSHSHLGSPQPYHFPSNMKLMVRRAQCPKLIPSKSYIVKYTIETRW